MVCQCPMSGPVPGRVPGMRRQSHRSRICRTPKFPVEPVVFNRGWFKPHGTGCGDKKAWSKEPGWPRLMTLASVTSTGMAGDIVGCSDTITLM